MKITVDNINNTKNKLKTPWNFGVNTCHAILWTRNDLTNHAKRAASECGFRYVRFHNTISKHTGIYTEDKQGNPIYNFEKFDKIFDNVIACGYLPFFEVGFCPDALSQHTRDLCYYEADPSIPKSFEKWSALIVEMTKHIINRYGIECARKWYFEVWNEPDLFYDGTMDDYFELYDHTVTAIKSVDANLRVGGPATSKCLWIKEFIKHVEEGSEISNFKPIPCDFISTHAYPSDLAFLDSDYGDVELQQSNVMKNMFKRCRELMDSSSLSQKPLIMGEWNSSAGPFAENHDEKNNAAYIVKIFDDVKDIIDGSLYWNLSDIYEEQGFHYIPFHGGYGLFNINDIPKSSFWAFSFINELKGFKPDMKYDEDFGSLGAISAVDIDESVFRILMYYYSEPDSETDLPKDISLEICGISRESTTCEISAVTDNGGSAYEWWKKIGSPQFINADILDYITKKSEPVRKSKVIFKDVSSNCYAISEKLYPGDVILLSIKL